MIEKSKLRWGIIGTGNIATKFVEGLADSQSGTAAAVASRSEANAEAFAQKFGIPVAHGSYQALLQDSGVDVVYISTPHQAHARWAILAAEAGKHILCEKPLTINQYETMAVIEAARRHGVFLMEAFMYRCHPQMEKLREWLPRVGRVRLIECSFSFFAARTTGRLFEQELAGGGILDVGGYPVSFARRIAGWLEGNEFADPSTVKASGLLGEESRVDEVASAVLQFDDGLLAEVSCAIRVQRPARAVVYGAEGRLELSHPWLPAASPGEQTLTFIPRQGDPEVAVVGTKRHLYGIEADVVAEHLAQQEAPQMSWADTFGNMKTLDRWRQEIGLVLDLERPPHQDQPLHGRPVKWQQRPPMPYGKVPGLDREVSRLIMGADNQNTLPHACVMFDDFVERGGNTFDTAFIYGRGVPERRFGEWLASRKIRDDLVIIGKGAHTPNCNPEAMVTELDESLERMGLENVDIYMLHRDNPDIPVKEFVDALNEEQRKGRIGVFGGSNWALDRVDQANAYARESGQNGFSVVSNNFSLARMRAPVWGGCLTVSDPASREWFKKSGMALLAWSSQARGFFSQAALDGCFPDPDLDRCWGGAENEARRARAVELAAKKGVLPIQIALAYVLAQPFELFALFGPRTLQEAASSFAALEVELSEADLRWLEEG